MRFFSFSATLVASLFCLSFISAAPSPDTANVTSNGLQDLVTWDGNSYFVNGTRVMLLSGEIHPFRLPSPGLWLDVFQKVRALGFNTVSFYVNWALLEGEPGVFRADGIFGLEKFFQAATDAGIYLVARPGPYINAEATGGGFPGWLQTIDGVLRSNTPAYVQAYQSYIGNISAIIARAQITNGGPIILVQSENEYTASNTPNLLLLEVQGYLSPNSAIPSIKEQLDVYLTPQYMADLKQAFIKAGINVPQFTNDGTALGNWAPGTGLGSYDIYGFDDYPFLILGNGCPTPALWTPGALPDRGLNHSLHLVESPSSPMSIPEMQGGVYDGWGGTGYAACAGDYVGADFEKVIYKEAFAQGVKFMNIYMIYGGTNWGNIGESNVYTSYDYAAAITEDRQVSREKYSELKLQAIFIKVSPAYYLANPKVSGVAKFTGPLSIDLFVTQVVGDSKTAFYVVRHNDYASLLPSLYNLNVATSVGNVSIPQLGGLLSLNGRDSKIHVVDYDVGGINLIYSSGEVFSWVQSDGKSTLVLYGGDSETHEFAVPASLGTPTTSGSCTTQTKKIGSSFVMKWQVMPASCVVTFGNALEVHLLNRKEAYNYWTLDVTPTTSVIVKAGYLMRTASIAGSVLSLTGDITAATPLEVIAAPCEITEVKFNGKTVISDLGSSPNATLPFTSSGVQAVDFKSQTWKYIDSLPEITASFDDHAFTLCDKTTTNLSRNLTTPTSLYAGDYGYYAGSLLYRGHFVATGKELDFSITTQGGHAFGHSIWLNDTFLGSYTGQGSAVSSQNTYLTALLKAGQNYIITVLIDHTGLNEESYVNNPATPHEAPADQIAPSMKIPRGILNYNLNNQTITWRMTGNFGGVHYADLSRGPLNEGAMYAERKGYHLPGAPIQNWTTSSPFDGIQKPGVAFYATKFDLNVPKGYDVPMSFVFGIVNITGIPISNFRCQLFVNGYQFGKFINNIGPQTAFPVPQGILNHNGANYVALTLWAMDKSGAKLDSFTLEPQADIMTGYLFSESAPQTTWQNRSLPLGRISGPSFARPPKGSHW